MAKNLLAYIPLANDSTGLRVIGSEIAPVTIDQYTGDVRHNLRRTTICTSTTRFRRTFAMRRTRKATPCRASATTAADTVRC